MRRPVGTLVYAAICRPLLSNTVSWSGAFDPGRATQSVVVATSRRRWTWSDLSHAGPDANVTTVPFVGLGAGDTASGGVSVRGAGTRSR